MKATVPEVAAFVKKISANSWEGIARLGRYVLSHLVTGRSPSLNSLPSRYSYYFADVCRRKHPGCEHGTLTYRKSKKEDLDRIAKYVEEGNLYSSRMIPARVPLVDRALIDEI